MEERKVEEIEKQRRRRDRYREGKGERINYVNSQKTRGQLG